MTDEELQLCYDNWQRYKWYAEEKRNEIYEYLEHYKPRGRGNLERH